MNTYNITYLDWEVFFQTKYPLLVDWIEDYFSNEKIIRDVDSWKKLKKSGITDNEKHILKYIYENY